MVDGVLGVVGAVHDVAAAAVAEPEAQLASGDGVVRAAVLADPAGGQPFHHEVARHLQVEHEVDRPLAERLDERFGLADGAGEAVEDEAAGDGVGRARRSSTMPIITSSGTSPPSSMISAALRPSSVSSLTALRSMSPVEMWGTT